MDVVDQLIRAATAFELHGIPYMVIGGVAVSAWVGPRLTKDVDFKVDVQKRRSAILKQALIDAGGRPTAVEMRLLFENRFILLKTTDAPRMDVHLMRSGHDRAAFGQAPVFEYGGHSIRVARPEDLILYKLQAWRDQDLPDLVMLRHDVGRLDLAYIESWLDPIARRTALPMRSRWKEVRCRPRPGDR